MISFTALIGRMFPQAARSWSILRIFGRGHGYWSSVKSGRPVDHAGQPIPWFTYPCIEYLKQFDFSRASIFEYGAGNSSYFWAGRALEVVSVENDETWYEQIAATRVNNQTIYLRTSMNAYVACLQEQGKEYDVIVIDGRWRDSCARAAIPFLSDGGMIILDNADWYPGTASFLREAGMLEIGFSGVGPINAYTWTTSIFIKASTRLQAGYANTVPIGGITQNHHHDKENI